MDEFEYCSNVSLSADFGEGVYPRFDGTAYLFAWCASRRLRMNSDLGYTNSFKWANQTRDGQAFSKLPQDVYKAWHINVRGYLPADRELYLGSLIGARDREFGVSRLKKRFLQNCRNAREAPVFSTGDEKNIPYTGRLSGLKKQLAKRCETVLNTIASAVITKVT